MFRNNSSLQAFCKNFEFIKASHDFKTDVLMTRIGENPVQTKQKKYFLRLMDGDYGIYAFGGEEGERILLMALSSSRKDFPPHDEIVVYQECKFDFDYFAGKIPFAPVNCFPASNKTSSKEVRSALISLSKNLDDDYYYVIYPKLSAFYKKWIDAFMRK